MRKVFAGAFLALLCVGGLASAEEIRVGTISEIEAAVESADPGDEIIILAGSYTIYSTFMANRAGTSDAPIVVRGEGEGAVILEVNAQMGFEVSAPYWTFKDLEFHGVCASDSVCEHAFHIIGQADHTIVSNCVMQDFNAQIKGNGNEVNGGMVFPNDVLIENSELFNTDIRNTGNPVTPIDVVGGQRWIVRSNFIHDHAKGASDRVSYAGFFKGNSKDGIFERNLVVCELLHAGGVRVGLALGGGGSSPDSICEESDCSIEHTNGIIRNNIIAHCPADVGLYLNEAVNTRVYNNIIYDSVGMDVRFSVSTADVRNNILSGEIRERDGGTATEGSNLEYVDESQWAAWYTDADHLDFSLVDGSAIVDLGETLELVTDDYCANVRDDGYTDIGPLEYDGDYDCDTTTPYEGDPDPAGCGGDLGSLLFIALGTMIGARRREEDPSPDSTN